MSSKPSSTMAMLITTPPNSNQLMSNSTRLVNRRGQCLSGLPFLRH